MPVLEALTAHHAQQQVETGSNIVIVPYSSYMEPSGDIRLSLFSETAAAAATELLLSAGTEDTRIVAVGEHTYGTDHVSTTQLTYNYVDSRLATAGALPADYPEQQPHEANSTPQQIEWLQQNFGSEWTGQAPVLVGYFHHWARIRMLCDMHGMRASFLDAPSFLAQRSMLRYDLAEASRLYAEGSRNYERSATRLTRVLSPLGASAVTAAFRTMSQVRTPTVVDVMRDAHGNTQLYATTAALHMQAIAEGRIAA